MQIIRSFCTFRIKERIFYGSTIYRTDDFKKSHWFYIFLQKKRNLHYHKVNDNHDKIGDSPYE